VGNHQRETEKGKALRVGKCQARTIVTSINYEGKNSICHREDKTSKEQGKKAPGKVNTVMKWRRRNTKANV